MLRQWPSQSRGEPGGQGAFGGPWGRDGGAGQGTALRGHGVLGKEEPESLPETGPGCVCELHARIHCGIQNKG